jgi:putative ATPase
VRSLDLFDFSRTEILKKSAPLAARMRPQSLDEFIGQEEVIGKGKLLRRSIETDQLTSVIFYGPPGTGKTTLAQIIARTTRSRFEQISAVTAGVLELRKTIQSAKEQLGISGRKSVLFIDEIHRFNKAQQDALLPAVEDGIIILIGATTENPYFEVNSALLSRSIIFQFQALTEEDVQKILKAAMNDRQKGLGTYSIKLHEAAQSHFVEIAGGDARVALNAFELAVLSTPPNKEGVREITLEIAEQSIQRRAVRYDKSGDNHYDVTSAFIKSIRGSDPDAVLHWLARMIDAGEDPNFIIRRIIICAAEDVGLADPHALCLAVAAAQALTYVGMPEARIPIAEAALYVACAPKSNAVISGIDVAMSDVRHKKTGEVPLHLRDAHYPGAKTLDHGKGYRYPHSYKKNYVRQQYLPKELAGTKYYKPSGNGYEDKIQQRLGELGLREKE